MGAHDREFHERFTAEFVREFPRSIGNSRKTATMSQIRQHNTTASSRHPFTDGIKALLDALVTRA